MSTTTNIRHYSDYFRAIGAQHHQEGHEEGLVEKAAADVLAVLDARGFTITPQTRAQITSTTDLDTLNQWLRNAVNAPSIDDALT